MPTRTADPRLLQAASAEYSGKWVAWSADHVRVLAHAETLQQLWQLVRDEQIVDPVFEKVPRVDVRFVVLR